MLGAVACYITNCPISYQSSLQQPFARFLNDSTISLKFPFTQKFIQVSEYENFTVTNAEEQNTLPITEDPSGNCFINANNALPSKQFEVVLDYCNYVEFRFNASHEMERVVDGNVVYYKKDVYYKVDNKPASTQIIKNVQIVSHNQGYKLPHTLRYELELPWNACDIQTDAFLHSYKRCTVEEVCSVRRKQKLQYILDGHNVTANVTYKLVDCERKKISSKELLVYFVEEIVDASDENLYIKLDKTNASRVALLGPQVVQINGQNVSAAEYHFVSVPGAHEIKTESETLIVQLSNNSRQYIKYTYKPNDTALPVYTKAGEVCAVVSENLFLQAKQKYLDDYKNETDPSDPNKPTDPSDPDGEDPDPNPPTPGDGTGDDEITCEEGQKVVDGKCVDGVVGIGLLFGAIAGAAAILM